MICNDNLVHYLVSAIPIRQSRNFDMRILERKESSVVETEYELTYSCAANSVQPCQPRLVLKIAGEAVVCTLK